MRDELQSRVVDVIESDHFWGFGRLLAMSCLFQLLIFTFVGFLGILYSALMALAVMWFCTTVRVVEQPDFEAEMLAGPSGLKITT